MNYFTSQGTHYTVLSNRLTRTYLEGIKANPDHTRILTERLKTLKQAEDDIKTRLEALLTELEQRKNDPEFVEAARSWTTAPDSDGKIGRSGRGFSGGLVHFFEYRSGVTKRERFKTIPEPMTVDGFIDFTNRLKGELNTAENALGQHLLDEPNDEPDENYTVVLGDARGNMRFYILRPNNDLILAYKKPGQDVKLSTMITGASKKYVDDVVTESINGEDRGRLNKLGPRVRRIMRKYPTTEPDSNLETLSKSP